MNRLMKDKHSKNKICILFIVGVILGLGYTIYTKANDIITENNIYAVIGFFITLTPICMPYFFTVSKLEEQEDD